jgi:tape measure domain-containing protein
MADDSDSLVLSISADVRQVKRALDRLVSDTQAEAKAIENAFKGVNVGANSAVASIAKVDAAMARSAKNAAGLGASLKSGLGGLGIGVGIGFGVQQAQALIDSNIKITNAFKIAGLEGDKLSETYDKIALSAKANGAPFEALAKVYGRLAIVQKDLGISSEQNEKFTANVAAALRVQGVSANDAQGPLLQLTQLLSTGKVRAEEFNSVNEGLPIILKTVAAGMFGAGASIVQLQQKMKAGELTSKEFFDAFMKGGAALREQAAKAQATIGQSMENIKTSLIIAIGALDQATGASAALASAIDGLVSKGEALATGFKKLTGVDLSTALAAVAKNAMNPLGDAMDNLGAAGDEMGKRIVASQTPLQAAINDTATEVIKLKGTLDGVGEGSSLKSFEEMWTTIVQGAKDGTLTIAQVTGAQTELNKVSADFPGDPLFEAARAKLEELQAVIEKTTDSFKEIDRSGKQAGLTLVDFATTSIAAVQALTDAMETHIGSVTSKIRAMISEAKGDLETMTRDIAKGAPLGQIPPVTSGGGSFLNPDQLQTFQAQEAGLAAFNEQAAKSIDLIKQREGFITNAKWDVNHFRVGFGSDTYVDAMGKVQKVTKDTVVTLEQANADLSNRIGEFQSNIQKAIGPETWKSLSDTQQAALTDIAYNYGKLPASIVKAIQDGGGPDVVAKAINALGTDNGGVNAARRKQDAQLFGGAAFTADNAKVKATPEQVFSKDTAETQRRIEALQAEYDALNKTSPVIKDYGYNVAYAAEQQRLLGEAQKAGVTVTPELQAQINGLADGYARAAANVDKLKTSQAATAAAAQEFNSMAKDFVGGFISDMMNGKSATEALGNALARLADQLLQMALNQIFMGSAGSGGLFGALFGGVGAAEQGGIVGQSRLPQAKVGRKAFLGARHMSNGGMIGVPPGGTPIIAHKGELILPRGITNALRGGGANQNSPASVTNRMGNIAIDMSGSGMVSANGEDAKAFGRRIQSAVQLIMVQESRPGGLLRRAG